MTAGGRSQLGWTAGAVFVFLLVVDALSFLESGYFLYDHVWWFAMGSVTALSLAASVRLWSPARH